MISALLLSAALAAGPAMAKDAPRPPGQLLNLSCVEALVAIDQQRLAGVFSFVSEKDSPSAFADLLTHDKKALKKFVAKVQKDLKLASGISEWDKSALQAALALYDSPLASTLEPPGESLKAEAQQLAGAPVVPLDQITAARRKG